MGSPSGSEEPAFTDAFAVQTPSSVGTVTFWHRATGGWFEGTAIWVTASATPSCTSMLPAVSVAMQRNPYVFPSSPLKVALVSVVFSRNGVKLPPSTDTSIEYDSISPTASVPLHEIGKSKVEVSAGKGFTVHVGRVLSMIFTTSLVSIGANTSNWIVALF